MFCSRLAGGRRNLAIGDRMPSSPAWCSASASSRCSVSRSSSAAAPAAGRPPLGRPRSAGPHRPRPDLPAVRAHCWRSRSPAPAEAGRHGRNGFGLGLALGVLYVPCAGPVLAAIIVAGSTGRIGVDTVVLTAVLRHRRRAPAADLRAGRAAGSPSASPRSATRQRRIRIIAGIVMIAAGRRAGLQPARRAAARHPRLHRRAAGEGRQRRAAPRTAQPRRPRQRPEQATVELHATAATSSRAAAPHRTSRASPSGSTPRATRPST